MLRVENTQGNLYNVKLLLHNLYLDGQQLQGHKTFPLPKGHSSIATV